MEPFILKNTFVENLTQLFPCWAQIEMLEFLISRIRFRFVSLPWIVFVSYGIFKDVYKIFHRNNFLYVGYTLRAKLMKPINAIVMSKDSDIVQNVHKHLVNVQLQY